MYLQLEELKRVSAVLSSHSHNHLQLAREAQAKKSAVLKNFYLRCGFQSDGTHMNQMTALHGNFNDDVSQLETRRCTTVQNSGLKV